MNVTVQSLEILNYPLNLSCHIAGHLLIASVIKTWTNDFNHDQILVKMFKLCLLAIIPSMYIIFPSNFLTAWKKVTVHLLDKVPSSSLASHLRLIFIPSNLSKPLEIIVRSQLTFSKIFSLIFSYQVSVLVTPHNQLCENYSRPSPLFLYRAIEHHNITSWKCLFGNKILYLPFIFV